MASRPRRDTKPSARARDVADATGGDAAQPSSSLSAAMRKGKVTTTMLNERKAAAKKKAVTKPKAQTSASASKKRKKKDSSDEDDDYNDDGNESAEEAAAAAAANGGSGSDDDQPVPAARPTTARAAAAAAVAAKKRAAAKKAKPAAAGSGSDDEAPPANKRRAPAKKEKKSAAASKASVIKHSLDTVIACRVRHNMHATATRVRLIIHSPPSPEVAAYGGSSPATGDVSSHYFMVAADDQTTFGTDNNFINLAVRPLPVSITDTANALVWSTSNLRGHQTIALPVRDANGDYAAADGAASLYYVPSALSLWHAAIAEYRSLIIARASAKPKKAPAKRGRAAAAAAAAAFGEAPLVDFDFKAPYYTTRVQRLSAGIYGTKYQIGECTNDGMLVLLTQEGLLSSAGIRPSPQVWGKIDELFVDALGHEHGYAADLETHASDNLSRCSGDTNHDANYHAAQQYKAEMKAADVNKESSLNKPKRGHGGGDGDDDNDDNDSGRDESEGMVAERGLFKKYIDMTKSDLYLKALQFYTQTTQPGIMTIITDVTPLIRTIASLICQYTAPVTVTEDMVRRHRVEQWLAAERMRASWT